MTFTKIKLAAAALLLVGTGSAVLFGQAPAPKPGGGLAQARTETTARSGASSRSDDQVDLELLDRAWVDAIPRRDATVIGRILANDFEGIDPVGNIFTKASYMSDLKNGVFASAPIELDEIKTRVFGDAAVVTSRVKVKTWAMPYRMTNVYVKRQGRWLCVASHSSSISGGVSPGVGYVSAKETYLIPLPSFTEGPAPRGAARENNCIACHVSVPHGDIRPLHSVRESDPHRRDHVTTIRPPFDCRVVRINVGVGEAVKKGDAMLQIVSADLAAAKGAYEMASIQWKRDKTAYDYKKPLVENNTMSRQMLIEAENDEAQSRLKMKLAKDKLLIYGLTEEEIANIGKEEDRERTRYTIRSRGDGVVLAVDAVLGNDYDRKDVLIKIGAPPAPAPPKP